MENIQFLSAPESFSIVNARYVPPQQRGICWRNIYIYMFNSLWNRAAYSKLLPRMSRQFLRLQSRWERFRLCLFLLARKHNNRQVFFFIVCFSLFRDCIVSHNSHNLDSSRMPHIKCSFLCFRLFQHDGVFVGLTLHFHIVSQFLAHWEHLTKKVFSLLIKYSYQEISVEPKCHFTPK